MTDSKTCSHCGASLPSTGVKFCPSCGAHIPEEATTCHACGTAIQPGTKFCAHCGASLTTTCTSCCGVGGSQSARVWFILIITGIILVVLFIYARKNAPTQEGTTVPIQKESSAVKQQENITATHKEAPIQKQIPPATEPSASFKFAAYKNDKFHFATQLPAHWELSVADGSLVFSGKKNTEDYVTTINFQIIYRNDNTSLDLQAQDLQDQLSAMKSFSLISNEKGQLAGSPAVRMIVSYQTANSTELYQQEQVIVEHGAYYYWIGYTTPKRLFDKYRFVMAEAMTSFHFIE